MSEKQCDTMYKVPKMIKAFLLDQQERRELLRFIPMMERYLWYVWEHGYDKDPIADWEMAALSFAMQYTAEGFTESYENLERLIRDHVDVVKYNSSGPQAIPVFLTAEDRDRITRGGDSRGEPYHTNYLMKLFANIRTHEELANLLLIPYKAESAFWRVGIHHDEWHLEAHGDMNVDYYHIVIGKDEIRVHDNYDGPAMIFRPDPEDEDGPAEAHWILVKDESSFFKRQYRSAVRKYYDGDKAEFDALDREAKLRCVSAYDSGYLYLYNTERYAAVRYRGFKKRYEKWHTERYGFAYRDEYDYYKELEPKMTDEECREECEAMDEMYKRFITGQPVSPQDIQWLNAYDMLHAFMFGRCVERKYVRS